MRKIEIKPYTIIMTIGPSNCGKSYFCENYLIPFLDSHNISNKYFSSDKIRQQLLNNDLHKHDKEMMTVSKQAFSLLESGVDNYTQYPVNTSVIIVDATHLSKLGRKNIIEIAKKNHYSLVGVMFDYKVREDYFKYTTEKTNKRVIFDMVKTFKETTIKELERDAFESIIKIESTEFDKVNLSFEDKNNFIKLPPMNQVCYVGDIHGCLDEFKAVLLDGKGLTYDPTTNALSIVNKDFYVHHILVGDYVDKGPKIKETIEFLHNNMSFFTIAIGNHEHWVYQYLKGNLKKSPANDELIDSWFDSVRILENDEELKSKFFTLVESSYDFILTNHSIVTHAPCENKYLAKSDKISLKKQRNIRYPKLDDYENEEAYLIGKEKAFDFLLKDGDNILPLHIFGHTMLKDVYTFKNKVCLDTGCVVGGSLSTGSWKTGQRKLFIKKYPSHQPKKEKLGSYFRTRDSEISFSSLDFDLQKRVKWAAKNKLNFISGTMSPCDKFEGDLESLEAGLNYFKSKGVERVVLQPKLMGSRANMWIHKTDVSKCIAFSRQGFEIKETRITSPKTMAQLFAECQKRYANVFVELNAEMILFDGELLPWNAMGKDLIEKEFMSIAKGLESEVGLLKQNGFPDLWNEITERANNLIIDESTTQHQIREKKQVEKVKEEIQTLDQMKSDVDKYTYQVNLFASDAELEFRAFSVLKFVKNSGEEINYVSSSTSNIILSELLNLLTYCVVDFDYSENNVLIEQHNVYIQSSTGLNTPYKIQRMTVVDFWTMITKDKEMEGVVIKPEFTYVPGVAPYLKCRNKEYLRITYGPDYQSLDVKKNKLIRNKSIKRKIETSIKEWELGRKLLDISQKDISIDNKKWIGLITQLMAEQEKEGELDPRL